MDRLKISDFVKLTGSTLKTVLYYHKIGLLKEPERSSGGYRIYGAEDLLRMQQIKHLKSIGLDLKRIKEIVGGTQDKKPLKEVLISLNSELVKEKEEIEERIKRISQLIKNEAISVDSDNINDVPSSFNMITDILGADNIKSYNDACPELYDQHKKLYGILDDFKWGEDYKENFKELAEIFKSHPDVYKKAIGYGVRLTEISKLNEDDPEIDALAHEAAEFIKGVPELKEILCKKSGVKSPLEGLYNGMAESIITPSQERYGQLVEKYLSDNS